MHGDVHHRIPHSSRISCIHQQSLQTRLIPVNNNIRIPVRRGRNGKKPRMMLSPCLDSCSLTTRHCRHWRYVFYCSIRGLSLPSVPEPIMSSTSTASKPSQSINTTISNSSPTDQSKLPAASPQTASRTRPTHSATHIRQRSIELKDIVTSSPTARRMSMSSTPQDVTDRGEGVVARSLRYAEWVVAGLCAWSLL
jgi:hypothetical protein